MIRRRLKEGRLRGERRHTPQGHVWLVHVPVPVPVPPPAAAVPEEVTPAPTPPSASAASTPAADGGLALAELAAAREAVTRLEAHNTDLRAQVETLTGELAARRREVTELHTLVGMVSRALPAPATSAVDPIDSPGSPAVTHPATPAADRTGSPPAGSSPDREGDRSADPPASPAASPAWWRRVWGWLAAG